MCLAYPGKVVEIKGSEGIVELAGNRHAVNLVLLPGVEIGQYVLVHAGYAIRVVEETVARETWDIFKKIDSVMDPNNKPEGL